MIPVCVWCVCRIGIAPRDPAVNWFREQTFLASDRVNRITFDPALCGGRPCLRGMRIRVSDVLELLASGASYEEILRDYPYLEHEDILAAIEYAARQTDHPVLLSA